MEKLRFLIGTHNHLPIGQPDFQTENIYQKALKPFLSSLYSFPALPAALYYSGQLLEWLEEHHPEFVMLLVEMVKRKQVEVLGGGYYDPVLSMIPANDRLGQLEKMTTFLRVKFENRPRGCWLPETVWEPCLASILRSSGLDFTFLEDTQFRLAGVEEGELMQPRLAEDQGKIVTVFPVSTMLSVLLERGEPKLVVDALKAAADTTRRKTAVMMMEGSRLGALAGPDAAGPAGGWLADLMRRVTECTEWLEPTTPTRCLREAASSPRLYIPSSASSEMTLWALPPRRRKQYLEARKALENPDSLLAGGYFRQFLSRYPEGELLYAKMMYTHVLVNQIRGDKYKKKAAQNELWKGQSNHAYWYGGNGGIYSNVLRKAVYSSLIEAEKITRATEIFAPSIISVDFDMDNNAEHLYQGSELNGYIHLRGGVLFELDFLPAAWNYLDTMARRDEGMSTRRRDQCTVDSSPRRAFMDHFFAQDAGIEGFDAGTLSESGDFIDGLYEVADLNRSLPEVLLKRSGAAAQGCPAEIQKRFIFRPRSIDVYYRLTNTGSGVLSARFGVEINLSLASRSPESGRIFLLEESQKSDLPSERTERDGVTGLLVRDVLNGVSITLSSANEFLLWSLPVETATPHADDGVERIFQSYCFVPQWRLELEPGQSWENHLSVGFEKTTSAP